MAYLCRNIWELDICLELYIMICILVSAFLIAVLKVRNIHVGFFTGHKEHTLQRSGKKFSIIPSNALECILHKAIQL